MDEMTKTFELNTVAVFSCIMAFLDLLDKGNKKGNLQQKSQIIATSSIAGFNRNAPGGFSYGQSKAATTHLMKQLGTQLVPYDIRCNTIAPGGKFSNTSQRLVNKFLTNVTQCFHLRWPLALLPTEFSPRRKFRCKE